MIEREYSRVSSHRGVRHQAAVAAHDVQLYVVLPVHNRRPITLRCCRDLLKQRADFHLVLIDDGCTDGTADAVSDLFTRSTLTVIRGDGKWFWGGSLERARLWLMQNAHDDDTILILNDDVRIPRGFLRAGFDWIRRNPDSLLQAIAFSESGSMVDRGTVVDWSKFRMRPTVDGEQPNLLTTRGLILRCAVMRALGPFYPRLLPHYGSDFEYTHRAYRRGYKLATTPEFSLIMNQDTTGVHRLKDVGTFALLRLMWSNKYSGNPVTLTALILLACPRRYVALNLVRVWRSALLGIAKRLVLLRF